MNDPNWIPINERYALYDNIIGKARCRYIIDLSKGDGMPFYDRMVDSGLRYTPNSADPLMGHRWFAGPGYSPIKREEFFSRLLAELPDVFEFLLWNPELL